MTRNFKAAAGKPRRRFTVEELKAESIQKSSRKTYESHIRSHRAAGFAVSYAGYVDRILEGDDTKCCTLEVLRSAIQWEMYRQPGGTRFTPGQLDEINCLLRGRRNLMGVTKKRGAITFAMLDQMLGWLVQTGKGTQNDQCNLIIAWATGLRSNQLEALRRHNVELHKGRLMVSLDENHNPTRLNRDEPFHMLQDVDDVGQALLRKWLQDLGPEDLVLPTWDRRKYGEWIHEAALALGWDTELNWAGVHQLRHGLAVSVADVYGLDAVGPRLGHQPQKRRAKTGDTYGKPNAARVAATRKAGKAASAARAPAAGKPKAPRRAPARRATKTKVSGRAVAAKKTRK